MLRLQMNRPTLKRDVTNLMPARKSKIRNQFLSLLSALLALTLFVVPPARAQDAPAQKTFDSPGAAVEAMIAAVTAHDKDALLQIFGPDSKPLISSGDPVADRNTADLILQGYQQMNRIVLDNPDTATLYIGAVNWPFPIPIVKADGMWHFDTAAGAKEVIYRRIGRNELSAIQVCDALVDAQREYFSQLHDGSAVHQYAAKFVSDSGKQNGLYWPPAEGQPESPVGPLVAMAVSENYTRNQNAPTPFHGYIFKLLQEQGPAAAGGARKYIVKGNMTGGFAFLAYPVEYRNSGVMTFLVGKNGVVYQKDLGPDTGTVAPAITAYNPGKGWQKAE